MIKNQIKKLLGTLQCLRTGVKIPRGGVYIGRHVHVVNGKRIVLGKDVQIRPDVDLFVGKRMVIGDRCDIGTRNRITGNVILENNVLLGPDNYLSSEDHCYEDILKPVMDQGTYSIRNNGHEELQIGEGSWIGTHVAIIGDVHIGKHCVIGANAVVTKDIPDYCVVVGVPARIVRRYNLSSQRWEGSRNENTDAGKLEGDLLQRNP